MTRVKRVEPRRVTSQAAVRHSGRDVYSTICVAVYPEDIHRVDRLVSGLALRSRSEAIRRALVELEAALEVKP